MWELISNWQTPIISAILALIVGVLVERYRLKQPRLTYYLGHVADFSIPTKAADGTESQASIYTHSITITNQGRGVAHNIEVAHYHLNTSNFWYRINPEISFDVGQLSGGGLVLKFPMVHPRDQISIAYLYTYPYEIASIHNYVRSDEVLAKPISVIPVQQFPIWVQRLTTWLAIFGLIYVAQLIIVGAMEFIRYAASTT